MRKGARWGFRVASRPQDGWGHVLRCLSLAQAMHADVTFFIDPNPVLEQKVQSAEHGIHLEPVANEARALRNALARLDGCLFDGYDFGPEIAAAADTTFTAQILDFAEATPAHFAIAPGLQSVTELSGTAIISGPRYALLRPEFAKAHDKAMQAMEGGSVRRLLISFGGRDNSNATSLVLDAVAGLSSGLETVVVMAGDAPHGAEVEENARRLGAKVVTHVDDMVSLYLASDLAIGAGGVSLLERMCCGLPSLIIALADNQLPNASAARALEAAHVIGTREALDARSITAEIQAVCSDETARVKMRRRGLELVDGHGAERAAAALENALVRSRVNSISL